MAAEFITAVEPRLSEKQQALLVVRQGRRWRRGCVGGGRRHAAAGHAVDVWGPSNAYWVPFGVGIACAIVAGVSITFARPKERFAHN